MVDYPSVQLRAQEELDTIIGRNRLADFGDEENLPYLKAVYKEILRFYPLVPLVTPHVVMEEDSYKGIRIPRGAKVVANAWWVVSFFGLSGGK